MSQYKNKALLIVGAVLALLLAPASVHAAIPITCPDGYETNVVRSEDVASACENHQDGVQGNDDREAQVRYEQDCTEDGELNQDNCGIIAYIVTFINILSGLVGIVVVIMITVGGIQYAAAGSNPQAVAAARKRISNAVLALVLYIFMFAFLQWLVPGGIF